MFLFKAEKILKTLFSNTTLLVRPLYFDTTETRSAYDSVRTMYRWRKYYYYHQNSK